MNATLSLHQVTAVAISDEKKHDSTVWHELEITTENGSRMVIALFPSNGGMTIKQQEAQ